ncbi:MAG TPA: dienelactone hydrolase family protein [bacterium]|nr:dienelactone hydrolase family protein [bacterium]
MPRDPHRDQPVLQGGAPLVEAAGVLVLLHGRGGSAQDMLAMARDLDRPQFAWFVPEAAGRQWYPYSLLEKPERNQSHLASALALIKRVLGKAEAGHVPLERVLLLGFSQGASVALEFAARNARRYGGLVALSGALLGPEGTPRDYQGSLANMPVFLGSGDVDPHIPKRRVDETAAVFERLGAKVTKRIYTGLGHAIDPDEIGCARVIVDAIGA